MKKLQKKLYYTHIQKSFESFVDWSDVSNSYSGYAIVPVLLDANNTVGVNVEQVEWGFDERFEGFWELVVFLAYAGFANGVFELIGGDLAVLKSIDLMRLF